MKSMEQYLWKLAIALMILVAWIGCGGGASMAPPSPQSGGMMVSSDDMQRTDETAIDEIGKNLVDIAQRASRESTKQMVDLVFIVNWKMLVKKLDRRVEKLQGWVTDMASVFDESMIDYRVAFIYFQAEASEARGEPLEKGLIITDRGLSRVSEKFLKFRGIVARGGLDAIMAGLTELKFSWEAEGSFWDSEKLFIVMTHEVLTTDWGTGREDEVIEKIVDRCREDEVQINVLGIDEEVQIQLANLTGGEWYRIERISLATHEDLNPISIPFLPKINMIFERIAQHIADTVKQPVDIVFILDSSLSMDDKVEKICTGLDTLVQVLDSEGLDYRFGVIRFWAAGGRSSSVLTMKPPLNAEQIKQLFRGPRRGNEHLLDAIMEGIPKLQTPGDRKLVLFVITDELASSGPGTGHTYTEAVEVCYHAGAQVNIIGAVAPLGAKAGRFIEAEKFQHGLVDVTNGKFYIMPGAMPSGRDRHTR